MSSQSESLSVDRRGRFEFVGPASGDSYDSEPVHETLDIEDEIVDFSESVE